MPERRPAPPSVPPPAPPAPPPAPSVTFTAWEQNGSAPEKLQTGRETHPSHTLLTIHFPRWLNNRSFLSAGVTVTSPAPSRRYANDPEPANRKEPRSYSTSLKKLLPRRGSVSQHSTSDSVRLTEFNQRLI